MTESPCPTWSSSKIDRNNIENEEIGPERVINGIPPRSISVGSQKKKKKKKSERRKDEPSKKKRLEKYPDR